jgi:hypothetical protein
MQTGTGQDNPKHKDCKMSEEKAIRAQDLILRNKRSLVRSGLFVCLPAFLIGCATVNPEPFVKYKTAVQEAQSGIDAALSVNYNWTRSGFIEDFSRDPGSRFSTLVIQQGAGYDWKIPTAPIYLDIKQTRSALAELNKAFTDYAGLLVRLSGGDLVSIAKFDQLAQDLNRNSADALKAVKLSVPAGGVALFSTAASEAARLYIENKRQGYLAGAITANQSNIQGYADLCISFIQTIRCTTKSYHNDRVAPIAEAWAATTGDKRMKNTEAILNLNEQFADVMLVLQELETTYRALPQAHADLAGAIEQPQGDFDGIQKLYSSAKRLQNLYDELKKAAGK